MIIEYHRTHFNSHPPTRGNPSDAGLDVYFSPKEREAITIEPGQSVILSTGLKFGVPHGYMLEVKNRSGVASKRSLIVGACVVIRVMTEKSSSTSTTLGLNHRLLSRTLRLHRLS